MVDIRTDDDYTVGDSGQPPYQRVRCATGGLEPARLRLVSGSPVHFRCTSEQGAQS